MLGIDLGALDTFQTACLVLAASLLLWDTVEVGRNDAANLVNAVFGARVLRRRTAIIIAGIAVVAGAVLSSDVMDTARKGIFSPTAFAVASDGFKAVLAIYISVYIVDTVLLYGYSAFGMPVSTTACLVFELLGASLAMSLTLSVDAVDWNKSTIVIAGIFCSIVLSGFASFMIQRAARGAIRDKATSLGPLLLHGGWIGGGLCSGLCYFLLLKGMKDVWFVKAIQGSLHRFDEWLDADISTFLLIGVLWAFFAIFIHVLLIVFRKRAAELLFPVLAILGMIAMGFAFGQNDLANCASPGLSVFKLLGEQNLEDATEVPIQWWQLLVCGLLLFAGMTTKNAERVTKAAVSTGSMGDHVALWAPRWCVNLATRILNFRGKAPSLAPRAGISPTGKTIHYDSLRASVITAVSASVIATASSLGLPVSTTYVAFAAVMATGLADRIFQRGDAELKLGRTIWVMTSWILSALIAATAAACVVLALFHLSVYGMAGCLLANLAIRRTLKKRADAQVVLVEEEAYERAHPEEFALETEG